MPLRLVTVVLSRSRVTRTRLCCDPAALPVRPGRCAATRPGCAATRLCCDPAVLPVRPGCCAATRPGCAATRLCCDPAVLPVRPGCAAARDATWLCGELPGNRYRTRNTKNFMPSCPTRGRTVTHGRVRQPPHSGCGCGMRRAASGERRAGCRTQVCSDARDRFSYRG